MRGDHGQSRALIPLLNPFRGLSRGLGVVGGGGGGVY